jgi:hypothetical protein
MTRTNGVDMRKERNGRANVGMGELSQMRQRTFNDDDALHARRTGSRHERRNTGDERDAAIERTMHGR